MTYDIANYPICTNAQIKEIWNRFDTFYDDADPDHAIVEKREEMIMMMVEVGHIVAVVHKEDCHELISIVHGEKRSDGEEFFVWISLFSKNVNELCMACEDFHANEYLNTVLESTSKRTVTILKNVA